MKKVVALQTWSNGTITMDEKSVMDIDDTLADSLIAAGICADAEDYFGTGGGGGGGGGVLVVHSVNTKLDKTWQEIHDADYAVYKSADEYECEWRTISLSFDDNDDEKYYAHVGSTEYKSDTADGVLINDIS